MTIIGIDLSINSTGICVNRDGKYNYFIVTPEQGMTKKMREFSSSKIKILPYTKLSGSKEYAQKEIEKSHNIYYIVQTIVGVVKKYKPDRCVMEGVSYGSSGAVADLAGLQYTLRCELIKAGINFSVVTPMSLKKTATGNGNADKNEMVFAWKKCDPSIKDIDLKKVDDIADAFFLSLMG
ncbi:MAG: crossover junction endodeoxyribonuclease RuvC [Clostridiales bacterium]|nr:crossover junction endodeoxyribonuclease RuvC [Clostridiales bacterium]